MDPLLQESTAIEDGDVVIFEHLTGKPRGREPGLSSEEIGRYSRHLILPEVAVGGQRRLKRAEVLIVGMGGLGAPLGLYLAAAGVGKLGILDFDLVEYSNLQRQVTFGTSDVGRPKLEAARDRLGDINPQIEIFTHEGRLSGDNALEIIKSYDVVADCTDNFPARYLVNDACILLGKPDVYGAVLRFAGQAAVFGLEGGPCYRCLYPEPPLRDEVPSCADAGVLGVLPGIVGAIQANEVLKLILGAGKNLSGRLLLFDALETRFREVRFRRNPDCPVCGDNPSITELIDYEDFCGVTGPMPRNDGFPQIAPGELKKKLEAGEDLFLLDVREPHEFEICNLGGHLIPAGEIAARTEELDRTREIVVLCRNGVRSAFVVETLQRSGFKNVRHLRGGIHAWTDEVDPLFPKY